MIYIKKTNAIFPLFTCSSIFDVSLVNIFFQVEGLPVDNVHVSFPASAEAQVGLFALLHLSCWVKANFQRWKHVKEIFIQDWNMGVSRDFKFSFFIGTYVFPGAFLGLQAAWFVLCRGSLALNQVRKMLTLLSKFFSDASNNVRKCLILMKIQETISWSGRTGRGQRGKSTWSKIKPKYLNVISPLIT